MKNPNLSLWGLNEYMDGKEEFDGGLFTTIQLTPLLNTQTCIDTILQLWGSNDVIRSNPIIMKRYTDLFFLKNYDNFERMAEVLQADYNPLENYDRFENTSEDRKTANNYIENGTEDGSSATAGASNGAATSSGSGSTSGNAVNETGSQNTEHQISAMNSTSHQPYQPRDKDLVSARTDVNSNTSASNESATSSTSANEEQSNIYSNNQNKNGTNSGSDDFIRDSHIHGNIGITSNQNMITQELELRKFNIYNYIADLYAKEFIYRIW